MPPSKPLFKDDILRAMAHTKSNRAACRYLGVSYQHYKRYAKIHFNEDGKSLFDAHLNRFGKGIPKFLPNKGKDPKILDVIEGRIDPAHFSAERIKMRLIQENYLKECCAKCGFQERRVIDYKIPLLLNFLDNNKKNYKLDNIELLCYNCYFLYIGNVLSDRQVSVTEDFHPTVARQKDEPNFDWGLSIDDEENMKRLGIL